MVSDIFLHSVRTGRTALFSPASRPERVFKALDSDADIVIADLEDAVAAEDKEQARAELTTILSAPLPGRDGLVVRISEPSTPEGRADLVALGALSAEARERFAVMVAKTQSPFDINAVTEALGPDVPVIALIETASGALAAAEIARTPGVARLALGAIDLAAELGCDTDSDTAWHVRAQLVLASVSAQIPGPLESPCPDFRNLNVVTAAARRARGNGLTGILCIHPAQLTAAKEAFAPTRDEIAWAEKVIGAADGATAVDGQMIDRPVVLRAEAILAAR